ncbi:MAG TPA: hypothetical protein VK620_04915 [Bradyrhizobium sp.]|nr:hypothetical protein [Bradyrhizobium sp.]
MKEADAPFRLLCTNREWPSGCRACNYLDEVAPLHFRPQHPDGRIVLARSSSWKGLEQRPIGADRFEADFRDGS